ncbi:MAG: N-acetylgalactosamine 6-sulfate sulfatase [Verrucomicrobiales bacterium]|nr:N-acetylgalactosamine 6-sulfate sulfatase [Verrucomicrobiales bacterium]
MAPRFFYLVFSCHFLLLACFPARAEDAKPNILFLFTDDQAPWAFGAAGNKEASTPNLDQLAKEGMYLPNSFTVTPVCSPSRVELWTSRYGSEVGITDWIKPQARFFTDNPQDQPGIDPSLPNVAKQLKSAGYSTALIGKYHLGERPECHPTNVGFDYFMGFLEGGTTPENPTLEKDGENKSFKGLTVDILTEDALEYLKNAKDKENPFFLSVHYRAPHTKWLPVAPSDWEPFENLDPTLAHPDYPGLDVERAKRMMREYLASVKGVDRNVGRILKLLNELGFSENTVVVYTSDHGYNMAHNGIWHKGNGHWLLKKEMMPPATENIPAGQRPNLYDNSIRIPTIVRWPEKIQPGTVCENSVTNLDWFPTFAEIAGAPLEKDSVVRGRSIVSLLDGSSADWEDEVFLQYSTKHQSRTHMRGWRSRSYKLVRDFLNPERDEFYDLKADPGETENLIHRLPEGLESVIQEFDRKIRTEMEKIGDNVDG